MTLPTIEFISNTWARFPAGTELIDFRLVAKPPVAASVSLVVYQSSSNASTLTRVGEYQLDNIPSTSPTARILVPIKSSKRYTFVFEGSAHNLFPNESNVSLAFQARVSGGRIDDYGAARNTDGRAANVYGIFNCRRS